MGSSSVIQYLAQMFKARTYEQMPSLVKSLTVFPSLYLYSMLRIVSIFVPFGSGRGWQVIYVFVAVYVGCVSVWVAESFAVRAACCLASSASSVVSFHFFTSIVATSVSRTRPRLVTSSV